MALIKCPECGQMVSDQADVCIHCGAPIKKDVVLAKVVFKEESGMGEDCPAEITVDGKVAATLEVGKEISLALPVGTHSFQIAYGTPKNDGKKPNAAPAHGDFLIKDAAKTTTVTFKVAGFFQMKFHVTSIVEA
jgi:hypothetical protein